jgi:IS30 family transposase
MRVSHEAIYQSLYIQGRGALRRELTACVRRGRALRAPRNRTSRGNRSFVTDELLISERPAEVEDRAVPGHWEGDLILGINRSAIGTLVERSSRFTMLLHLPPIEGHNTPRTRNGPPITGAGAGAVRHAIADTIGTLPEQLRRSLTWDQGIEMAQHANSGSTPICRSTSAIREALGSEARTRTPTGCCANISPEAPTSPATAPRSSPLSQRRSTGARERHSGGRHPLRCSANT